MTRSAQDSSILWLQNATQASASASSLAASASEASKATALWQSRSLLAAAAAASPPYTISIEDSILSNLTDLVWTVVKTVSPQRLKLQSSESGTVNYVVQYISKPKPTTYTLTGYLAVAPAPGSSSKGVRLPGPMRLEIQPKDPSGSDTDTMTQVVYCPDSVYTSSSTLRCSYSVMLEKGLSGRMRGVAFVIAGGNVTSSWQEFSFARSKAVKRGDCAWSVDSFVGVSPNSVSGTKASDEPRQTLVCGNKTMKYSAKFGPFNSCGVYPVSLWIVTVMNQPASSSIRTWKC